MSFRGVRGCVEGMNLKEGGSKLCPIRRREKVLLLINRLEISRFIGITDLERW